MKTAIGTFLSHLRINRKELLKDMANNLEVSSSFLSAVENGKKKFPEKWYEDFRNLYGLNENELLELKQAVTESSGIVEINFEKSSNTSKALALCFARKFEDIDDELSKKIIKLLNTSKED